ncbi:MAG TPA: FMN-binding protein [Candidatus Paceibacterota bacterium]|nr:FMN-binding protein [Candidatus Paceibacterota bacterium]
MKKYILPIAAVFIIALYVVFMRSSNSGVLSAAPASDAPLASGEPNPQTSPIKPASATTSDPSSVSVLKDGTYTGKVADAFYGNLQAAVTIQGGKIVDVQFPQYPNASGHTSEVSSFALPALKQEAIQAQSANVNIVSGATQDSQAFQVSLADALAQAKT